MPQVRFEPTIPVFQRAKTVHVLGRPATMIDTLIYIYIYIYIYIRSFFCVDRSCLLQRLRSDDFHLESVKRRIKLSIKYGALWSVTWEIWEARRVSTWDQLKCPLYYDPFPIATWLLSQSQAAVSSGGRGTVMCLVQTVGTVQGYLYRRAGGIQGTQLHFSTKWFWF
jgi:hypothetical protein